VGLLAANGDVPLESIHPCGFIGELGLDGTVHAVPGAASLVSAIAGAVRSDDVAPVVPIGNLAEARALAAGAQVRPVATLLQVVRALRGDDPWPDLDEPPCRDEPAPPPDLADVHGQPVARLALEASAAGGHHLLMVGPPGSGKTMLAQRLVGVLPPLRGDEALEATIVQSAAGLTLPQGGLVRVPPFRAPHHTSSMVAMVGGGTASLRPGEVSLATGGVLFLDELGEFAPSVLDGLRQPLEEGVVRVARARASTTLPARFLLVAATNPCPCGGGPPGACQCDDTARARYLRRLSGPLLDRFDLRVGVERPHIDELLGGEAVPPSEPSATVAARVAEARRVALDRQGCLNSAIAPASLDEFAPLMPAARLLLRTELERDRLTGRGYHRVRRVARTLADLDAHVGPLADHHIALAMQLRVSLRTGIGRAVA